MVIAELSLRKAALGNAYDQDIHPKIVIYGSAVVKRYVLTSE